MNRLKKKPCPKCPYTLGLIHTVTNPCPECKLNGYSAYEWFRKAQRPGNELTENESYEPLDQLPKREIGK